jgi:hypothetical protein
VNCILTKPALTLLLLVQGLWAAAVTGELKQWHKVTITFDGPRSSESANPNPFLDHRLNVTFTKGSARYVVPGYFAADGNAAETSADSGNKWRVHFVPDEPGEWTYRASFRTGPEVAVSPDEQAGKPSSFDGESGTLNVGPTDATGRDHRARGMLRYVGEHYTRYAGSGEYFIMVGVQTPENFLAYYGFDGTENRRSKPGMSEFEREYTRMPFPDGLHHYEPHVKDWKPGDPTWQGGKGKGIIGVLNYLASKGMNTFYSLTMNVEGAARDIWPWTSYEERNRYDVSKLDQWEIVFSHMDRLGMQFIAVTQEEESEQLLGKLTTNRKLYYRELVARFAHHHGWIWDLDEEMDRWRYYTTHDMKDIANYIRAIDPYKHPIQYVQWKGELMPDDKTYGRLLGFPNFDGLGMQHDPENTHAETIKWVDKSSAAGHKWLAGLIEANPGELPDLNDYWHDRVRRFSIWGNLMASGSGTIFFFTLPNGDVNCEDFRTRDHLYDLMRYAHEFFTRYLPFHEMRHRDDLTPASNDFVFAREGEIYAVYLPDGGAVQLDLSGAKGIFELKWYDPRYGGALLDGKIRSVEGGGLRSLGAPPADTNRDWVALVRRPDTRSAEQPKPEDYSQLVAPKTRFHVKLGGPVNSRGATKGEKVTAVVMGPVQLRGGLLEGSVAEAQGGKLRLTFDVLRFGGRTIPIKTAITEIFSSKGKAGFDDLDQPVRIEAGVIAAEGAAVALEEGAEVRFVGTAK